MVAVDCKQTLIFSFEPTETRQPTQTGVTSLANEMKANL